MFAELESPASNAEERRREELAEAETLGAPVDDDGWGIRHVTLRISDARTPIQQIIEYHLHGTPGDERSERLAGRDSLGANSWPTERVEMGSRLIYEDGSVYPMSRMEVVAFSVVRKFQYSSEHPLILGGLGCCDKDEPHEFIWGNHSRPWGDGGTLSVATRLALTGDNGTEVIQCGDELFSDPQILWFSYQAKIWGYVGPALLTLDQFTLSEVWRALRESWDALNVGCGVSLPNGRRVALDLRTGMVVNAA